MHEHDSDTDDLDFAMLTPPTRPGPAKAATAPEMDPVERRLEREQEAARFIASELGLGEPFCACGRRWSDCDSSRSRCHKRVEVRHGSGKVKV